MRRGLVDEVVVQIYRDNLTSLGRELADPSLAAAARQVPVRIGLLAGLRSQPKPTSQLRQELDLVRGKGYRGIDLFFYESVRQHGPAGTEPRATDLPSSEPNPAQLGSQPGQSLR